MRYTKAKIVYIIFFWGNWLITVQGPFINVYTIHINDNTIHVLVWNWPYKISILFYLTNFDTVTLKFSAITLFFKELVDHSP